MADVKPRYYYALNCTDEGKSEESWYVMRGTYINWKLPQRLSRHIRCIKSNVIHTRPAYTTGICKQRTQEVGVLRTQLREICEAT